MSGRNHSKESIKKISDSKKGNKHSDETYKKISEAKKGENHPFAGRTHSEETLRKMSDAKLGQSRPEAAGRLSQVIEVFDNKKNQTTPYDSISAAARSLDINKYLIFMYLAKNPKKPYKAQYTFVLKKLEFLSNSCCRVLFKHGYYKFI
jgi:group I intron endonuclease